MALRNTILAAVDTAFSVAGDLAVDVTLRQSNSSNYDFATGETVQVPGPTVTIRGILLTAEKRSEDGNRIGDTLILRARDVTDIDVYDSFVIGGRQYRIESYTNNGYAIEVQISGR